MKKITSIMAATIIATSFVTANDSFSESKAWKNGFITAYKALKEDGRIQGLNKEKIPVKQFIVYFDATDKKLAEWDKLMIQMMGYTTSIHDPIRTTDNWIIFASFDSYGMAKQEMDMLNERLFEKQENKLKLFENTQNRVFLADRTLLTEDIKHLKEILDKQSAIKLTNSINKKNKEIADNQQVAIVYIDKSKGEQISPEEAGKFINSQTEKHSTSQPIEKEKTVETTKKQPKIVLGEEPSPNGFFQLKESTVAYKLEHFKKYNFEPKIYNVEDFKVIDIVSADKEQYPIGAEIEDKDGTKYFKVYKKNLFIDTNAAIRTE
jgi:hypothetical protein